MQRQGITPRIKTIKTFSEYEKRCCKQNFHKIQETVSNVAIIAKKEKKFWQIVGTKHQLLKFCPLFQFFVVKLKLLKKANNFFFLRVNLTSYLVLACNPLVSNAPFPYPLETSQTAEGCTENKSLKKSWKFYCIPAAKNKISTDIVKDQISVGTIQ